jgi:hypothetical protein
MRSPFCYMHDLYGALASPCRHLSDLGEVQNKTVKACILCGVNCLLQGPLPSSQKPCSITRRKIESRFFVEVCSLRSTDHILSLATAAAVWQSWIDGLALRLRVFTMITFTLFHLKKARCVCRQVYTKVHIFEITDLLS